MYKHVEIFLICSTCLSFTLCWYNGVLKDYLYIYIRVWSRFIKSWSIGPIFHWDTCWGEHDMTERQYHCFGALFLVKKWWQEFILGHSIIPWLLLCIFILLPRLGECIMHGKIQVGCLLRYYGIRQLWINFYLIHSILGYQCL